MVESLDAQTLGKLGSLGAALYEGEPETSPLLPIAMREALSLWVCRCLFWDPEDGRALPPLNTEGWASFKAYSLHLYDHFCCTHSVWIDGIRGPELPF